MNDNWLKPITKKIKKLYFWFRKVIDYSVILWDDEDYDYSFILQILQYKISRVRRHIDDHKFFKGYEIVCKEMERAEYLLNLLINDDFILTCLDHKQAFEEKEKVKEELFTLLKDKIEGWWD